MGQNKFILGIIAATVLLLTGGTVLALKLTQSTQVAANPAAKAAFDRSFHEWGKIGINSGKAEAEFAIKNQGEGELKLFNVATSCMCTTAKLVLDGVESPEFGMHSQTTYVMNVPAGKEAKLKVVFDPAFHGPTGIGAITRQVKVKTNDPEKSELEFVLTAEVIN